MVSWFCCFQNDTIRYNIVDDEEGSEALQVFWLNSVTGVIMAIQPIGEREKSEYTVSL